MAIVNFEYLDNPGWYALNGFHRSLAIRGDIAVRYQPDVFAGATLTTYLAETILARKEIPFLTIETSNFAAARLYRKLGFQKRIDIGLTIVRKRES